MPHAVIEYSKESSVVLSDVVHQAMNECGLFDPEAIKTRAYKVDDFLVGTKGREGSFVHVTVSILTGRTVEQKKMLSDSILTTVRNALPDINQLTVDVREMEKEVYGKSVVG